ncbi:GNAT family N-acetyltransferase [Streptomyces sp. NPDC087908]|uniref:GNAT family N-acetyltransferase n=1 Tax=Streptomyces sp. NPDC087908 TaxID=3365820 RepID=UPI003823F186
MTSVGSQHCTPANQGNVLITERLTLRELPYEEVVTILDGRTVSGVQWAEGYPFEGTIGGAKLVRRMVEADTYRAGFGLYQVVLQDTNLVVGDIGFHSAPDENGSAEIGYGLVEAYRGQGIATEALRALVTWTLQQEDVNEVRAETDKGHLPSQRVLTKSGFASDGSGAECDRFVLRCG